MRLIKCISMRESRSFHVTQCTKPIQIEVSVKLAVDARQNIQVKLRGDSGSVVIGRQ